MRTTGPLTRRETEVIEHMADGLQNKEIAFALGMFSVTRLEMYLRAKRLLEEARGRG